MSADPQDDASAFISLLRQSPEIVALILNQLNAPVILLDSSGTVVSWNQTCENLMGYGIEQVRSQPFMNLPGWRTSQTEVARSLAAWLAGSSPESPEWEWQHPAGHSLQIAWKVHLDYDGGDRPVAIVLTGVDMTAQRQTVTVAQQQIAEEQLLGRLTRLSMDVAARIRESLDLDAILQTTVDEIRAFLCVERVAIYQLQVHHHAQFIVESVTVEHCSILGFSLEDPCFDLEYAQQYEQGKISAIADIEAADLAPCYIELLRQINVRAILIVPIISDQALWGLLCAHQCSTTRQWHDYEIQLLQQLADQVGIALQQSHLYARIQQLNTDLEQQVQEQTAELQQALQCEAILKQITDRVRDSLDEAQILQSAVLQLGTELGLECCETGIYSADLRQSTIAYEYRTSKPPTQGYRVNTVDWQTIYDQLFQGNCLQFCLFNATSRRPVEQRFTILACPLVDDRAVLGDLWLFKPAQEVFSELEIRLVQQVANQCAIAIRQARLYQATETQVEEMADLIRLKDEFLSRVSHELRTPVANMKVALQMLAITLNQERPFLAELSQPESQRSRLAGYYQVLRDECDREISLLNDLLDLQRLESGTHITAPQMIALKSWLPPILDSFRQEAESNQQQFVIQIAPNLPVLFSSPASLERVLRELLNNACKYTPAEERIQFTVTATPSQICFEVSNTGIEIPANQIPYIFERFHQVPSRDRWRQSGTGLGLALAQRLVKRLGGTLSARSENHQTNFIVELPQGYPPGGEPPVNLA